MIPQALNWFVIFFQAPAARWRRRAAIMIWIVLGGLTAWSTYARLHAERPTGVSTHRPDMGRAARLIWIVVDGLRADAASDPAVMPFLASRHSGIRGIASATHPAMTQTAVFAMGVGRAATLAESLENFVPPEAPAENLFAWLKGAGRTVHLLGDATWTHRYGRWATKTQPMPEGGHSDTHASDEATMTAALESLQQPPDVLVVHFVGPDHVAHADGVGASYHARLREIDTDIQRLASVPTGASILVVSDHGLDAKGSHGNGEPEAVEAPLVWWGPGVPTSPGVRIAQARLPILIGEQLEVARPMQRRPPPRPTATIDLLVMTAVGGLGGWTGLLPVVLGGVTAGAAWLKWWPSHAFVYVLLLLGLAFYQRRAWVPLLGLATLVIFPIPVPIGVALAALAAWRMDWTRHGTVATLIILELGTLLSMDRNLSLESMLWVPIAPILALGIATYRLPAPDLLLARVATALGVRALLLAWMLPEQSYWLLTSVLPLGASAVLQLAACGLLLGLVSWRSGDYNSPVLESTALKSTITIVTLGLLAAGCTPTSGGRRSSLVDSDVVAGDVLADDTASDSMIGFSDAHSIPDGLEVDEEVGKPPAPDGDAPDTGQPPTDEGTPPTDAGTPPTDEGTPPPDEGPDPPETPISGGVLIVEVNSVEPPVKLATVTTKFRYGPVPSGNPSLVQGPCQVIYSNGTAIPDPTPGLDAGVVTVTGLQQALAMMPVDQGGNMVYDAGIPESQETIISGSTVGVSSTGGAHVPPFSTGVTAPFPVQVINPNPNGEVDKDDPLTVTWNPGNGTHIRIDLFVYDGADEEQKSGNTIMCNIEGDLGSYSIPQSLMGMLPGGGSTGFPDFNFDYLVYGVSRIALSDVELPNGFGSVSLAVTRTGGGVVKLKD